MMKILTETAHECKRKTVEEGQNRQEEGGDKED
jgi:hypothetical protein